MATPTDHVLSAQARFAGLTNRLTEADARAPSALPGWSRGHVVTHVANVGVAFDRQIRAARAARLVDVYDGGRPARDAGIEAGAGRPVGDLRSVVTEVFDRLSTTLTGLDPDDWDRPVRYRDGTVGGVVYALWREITIHAVDLAVGATPDGWEPDLCLHLLDFLSPRLPAGTSVTFAPEDGPQRTYGSGVAVVVTGRLTDVTAWLAGRTPTGPVTNPAGDLPDLGPWP